MGGSGGMSQMYPQHTLADGPALTGQHNVSNNKLTYRYLSNS